MRSLRRNDLAGTLLPNHKWFVFDKLMLRTRSHVTHIFIISSDAQDLMTVINL